MFPWTHASIPAAVPNPQATWMTFPCTGSLLACADPGGTNEPTTYTGRHQTPMTSRRSLTANRFATGAGAHAQGAIMKYVRFALAGLIAASCLPAAWGGDPFYGPTADGYAGPYNAGPGYADPGYAGPGYGGYSAGCQSCEGGYGYGNGIGWGTPGCCDRPLSKAYGIWDGYCAEKAHGWSFGRCSQCDACGQACSSCRGGMFRLFGHKCHGCSQCDSCTTGGSCASCTSGGGAYLDPAQHAQPATDASGQEPPAPPQPPTTGRVQTRRAR
jgi:hypothetical protein